jgi:hypothetical protein
MARAWEGNAVCGWRLWVERSLLQAVTGIGVVGLRFVRGGGAGGWGGCCYKILYL